MQLNRSPRWQRLLWMTALATGLGLSGCDDATGPTPDNPAEMECGGGYYFRTTDFASSSHIVDNRWAPMLAGSQAIFDGEANRGSGLRPHRVVFTVTDLVKVVNGVACVVLWDRDYDYVGGHVHEAELAFFAQDKSGNVWLMGEYPEEYEQGEFVGAPSTWLAGYSGADAGMHMLAEPYVGARYVQGWAPEVNFLDCAVIAAMGTSTCVPNNCYENVLVIDERAPYEVGTGTQRKYYAPSIGNIRIGAIEDIEGETLLLTNIRQLDPEELAEARVEALRLEARAYEINETYARTRPMTRVQ
jgi:hypothetical protein